MRTFESLALRFKHDQLKLGELKILNQQLLPHQEVWLNIPSVEHMIEAIQSLKVRGAPLIGVAASFALAHSALKGASPEVLKKEAQALSEARPTAVNLMICIERMQKILSDDFTVEKLLATSQQIFQEDVELCDRIAENGADYIDNNDSILTHCNTGGLATAGRGTALGIIRRAHEQGKKIHVFVDETRPLLQGGRLTTWELQKLKIPFTLITDSMAGQLMSLGKIHKVFVGSDRIAANGDFANKIGTYSVAVLAHYHQIPFFVAAPYTTVDPDCASGQEIPIEQRNPAEVVGTTSLAGTPVYNPSFDVTPANLVRAWILDKGTYSQIDIAAGVLKRT